MTLRRVLLSIVATAVLAPLVWWSSAVASPARAASPKCSRAAALTALRQHPKIDPIYIAKLEFPGQVLCGAFLGPGSRAMVVSFAANVCTPGGTILGWAAFRVKRGSWQPVWKTWSGGVRIEAVGTDVKQTAEILRPGDACGNPTGGARSRTWHWNGTKFVGTAWQREAPAPPSKPAAFWGPDGIGCHLDAGAARCSFFSGNGTGSRFRTATLTPDGSVATCEGAVGNPGTCPDAETPVNAPVLNAGAHDAIGPFDCAVLPHAIECKVVATGQGFVITKQTATSIDEDG